MLILKDFLWWKHGVLYQIYPRNALSFSGSYSGELSLLRISKDSSKVLFSIRE